MTERVLLTERRGAVAILTMNRPEARNALSAGLVDALIRALRAAAEDSTVGAVVLTGAGGAFCGGADLKTLRSLAGASPAEALDDAERLKRLFRVLGTCPKPVVAAVDGPALAGGCGLVSLCDAAVASPGATFGYPEVRVGFVAAMVLVFLVRQVGERTAKEMLLSGRALSAAEAEARGLITRVAEEGRALDDALSLAESFQRGAPAALALTKELLWRTSGLSLDAALDMAAQANAFARSGAEMREGIEAFLDKRKPSWGRP